MGTTSTQQESLAKLAELIKAADELSQRALQKSEEETEARRNATSALNIAKDGWNEVYFILAALWGEQRSYPGLYESHLGVIMREYNHSATGKTRIPPTRKPNREGCAIAVDEDFIVDG